MERIQASVGRPRSFDEDEVVDRALDLFWSRGASGATTRLLANELGLTQSSIYNAFGSKSDLLARALDVYLDRIDAEIVAPLDLPDAGANELVRFVDSLITWISAPGREGCLLLNLLAEKGAADPALVERARTYRQRLRLAFARTLRNADADDAERRAEMLLAGVLGVNIAARSGADELELAALGDSLRCQIAEWTLSSPTGGRPKQPTG